MVMVDVKGEWSKAATHAAAKFQACAVWGVFAE
jgi:hypothetical protein